MTEEIMFSGKYLNVVLKDGIYEIVEAPNAVAVLATTTDNKVILVKQKRPSINTDTIEIPAGLIGIGETPLEAVKRELLEETGYQAKTVTEYRTVFHSSGYSTGHTVLFFATGCEKIAKQKLDENENIKIIEIPLSHLETIQFHDMKSTVLQLEYFRREYKHLYECK